MAFDESDAVYLRRTAREGRTYRPFADWIKEQGLEEFVMGGKKDAVVLELDLSAPQDWKDMLVPFLAENLRRGPVLVKAKAQDSKRE